MEKPPCIPGRSDKVDDGGDDIPLIDREGSLDELSKDGEPLSPDQVEVLRELRRLACEEYHDYISNSETGGAYLTWLCLLRFAIARGFSLDDAWEMLSENLRWRIEHNIDSLPILPPTFPTRGYTSVPDSTYDGISDEIYSNLGKHIGLCFHKFNKAGEPIWCQRSGYINANGIVQDYDVEGLTTMAFTALEMAFRVLMPEGAKRAGSQPSKITFVFDLKGLGMRSFVMDAMRMEKKVIKLFEAHCPERLGDVFIINVPTVFYMFFNIIKPLLEERTLNRIHILGDDYKDTLLKYVDAESLPREFGGSCECEGGCLPWATSPEYSNPNWADEGYVEQHISAGKSYEHAVTITESEVEEKKNFVEWKFKTVGKDISFELIHEESGEHLHKPSRVLSHENLISGVIAEAKEGTYRFKWDNGYSRWTSKKLLWKVAKST